MDHEQLGGGTSDHEAGREAAATRTPGAGTTTRSAKLGGGGGGGGGGTALTGAVAPWQGPMLPYEPCIHADIFGGAVQRQVQIIGGGGGEPATAAPLETAARGMQGGGGALPHADRIQAAFGSHDVSGVTSHQGAGASAAAEALSASAYTVGQHVAFAGSPSLHTAAHEAAHTVQQRAGLRPGGDLDEPGDALERHADAVADRVVAGESAQDLLDQISSGGGGAIAGAAVQRQRIVRSRDGGFTVQGWTLNPTWIRNRAMRVPSVASILGAFSVADLRNGATHAIALPNLPAGHTVEVTFLTAPGRGMVSDVGGTTRTPMPVVRNGVTVHPFEISIVRSASLAAIFPGGQITQPAIDAFNRDHARLQEALDAQVAESIVHEFTHLLLAIENTVVGTGPGVTHSSTFNDYAALLTAAQTPTADAAFTRVENFVRAAVGQIAAASNASPFAATVLPAHQGPALREWFVNELFTNRLATREFGHGLGNRVIAERYASGRIAHIRQAVANASGANARLPAMGDPTWQIIEHGIQSNLLQFFDAIDAAMQPAPAAQPGQPGGQPAQPGAQPNQPGAQPAPQGPRGDGGVDGSVGP